MSYDAEGNEIPDNSGGFWSNVGDFVETTGSRVLSAYEQQQKRKQAEAEAARAKAIADAAQATAVASGQWWKSTGAKVGFAVAGGLALIGLLWAALRRGSHR